MIRVSVIIQIDIGMYACGVIEAKWIPIGRSKFLEGSDIGVRPQAGAMVFSCGVDPCPKGPKYPNMEYLWFSCARNHNCGLGYVLHVWILGP